MIYNLLSFSENSALILSPIFATMDPSQVPVSNSLLDGSPNASGGPIAPSQATAMLEMVQAATQAAQAAAASAQSVAQLVSRAESSSALGSSEGVSNFQA